MDIARAVENSGAIILTVLFVAVVIAATLYVTTLRDS